MTTLPVISSLAAMEETGNRVHNITRARTRTRDRFFMNGSSYKKFFISAPVQPAGAKNLMSRITHLCKIFRLFIVPL